MKQKLNLLCSSILSLCGLYFIAFVFLWTLTFWETVDIPLDPHKVKLLQRGQQQPSVLWRNGATEFLWLSFTLRHTSLEKVHPSFNSCTGRAYVCLVNGTGGGKNMISS